jgi:hypothetical protein
MRRSPAVSEVVQDLFAGSQSYVGLKARLVGRAQRALIEIMRSLVLRRRLAEEAE